MQEPFIERVASANEADAALCDRVMAVIARTQKLPPETVTIDKTFEELKIDSLDGINILFALEGEFDIDIPDDAARTIRSIREMADGVAKLVAAKSAKASLQAEAHATETAEIGQVSEAPKTT